MNDNILTPAGERSGQGIESDSRKEYEYNGASKHLSE